MPTGCSNSRCRRLAAMVRRLRAIVLLTGPEARARLAQVARQAFPFAAYADRLLQLALPPLGGGGAAAAGDRAADRAGGARPPGPGGAAGVSVRGLCRPAARTRAAAAGRRWCGGCGRSCC